MATSIFSRKRDLVYLIHFCISLPLMFSSQLIIMIVSLAIIWQEIRTDHPPATVVDLQSLYPPSIVPEFMTNIKSFYINTYKDQFFVQTPPFFEAFMWTEVLYQAPVMMWSIGALYRGSPKIPLVLLPFATLIFISTATCMYEYSFWDVPLAQKIDLTTLYGPYLVLSAFMGIDMYLRLNDTINKASSTSKIKKVQ